MKKADKLGARYVAILGQDELGAGLWTVRDMGSSSQEPVPDAKLVEYFKEKLDG
jgi:histidyl-tRNA synthetase